jgi:OOP family OmpA-OmpF porin
MKKNMLAIMTIAGLSATSSAMADEHSWYVSIGIGEATGSGAQTTADQTATGGGATGFSSSLSQPTTYKLHVGYQFNKYLAVEGGYIGSNNQNYAATGGNLAAPATTSIGINGWNLVAVGILPVADKFSLLGKVGISSMQESMDPLTTAFSTTGAVTTVTGHKTDVTYGVGAKYDFTDSIFARVDLDSYNVGNATNANRNTIWALDVGFKF